MESSSSSNSIPLPTESMVTPLHESKCKERSARAKKIHNAIYEQIKTLHSENEQLRVEIEILKKHYTKSTIINNHIDNTNNVIVGFIRHYL